MDPVNVLLVEDNPGDVVLVREAVAEAGLAYRLTVVRDGVEAMDRLSGKGQSAGSPLPDLILLDLNLPRKTGLELLAEILADPILYQVPVVLLSSSRSELDKARAYALPPDRCLVKPGTFAEYVKLMHNVEAARQQALASRGGQEA